MWKLKQSGQFKKDLRKYQNDRDAKGSFPNVSFLGADASALKWCQVEHMLFR